MPATAKLRSHIFSRRLVLRVLVIMLATMACTGCNVVLLLGYLIGGPPAIDPDFNKKTGKSLSGKDKLVVVYCYAPNELKADHDRVDYEVATCVALRLNKENIKVADPDYVYEWIDKHPEFEKDTELGAAFNATHVIKIELTDYSLYAERSHDLFQGHCSGLITVWEMEKKSDGTTKKTGKIVYNQDLNSRFPKESPLASTQYAPDTFKKLFLSALSADVGGKFYPTYAGDEYTRTMSQ